MSDVPPEMDDVTVGAAVVLVLGGTACAAVEQAVVKLEEDVGVDVSEFTAPVTPSVTTVRVVMVTVSRMRLFDPLQLCLA